MTAYAALQNPTEWSFKKMEGKSEVKKCKNAKSRDNNKKAKTLQFYDVINRY